MTDKGMLARYTAIVTEEARNMGRAAKLLDAVTANDGVNDFDLVLYELAPLTHGEDTMTERRFTLRGLNVQSSGVAGTSWEKG